MRRQLMVAGLAALVLAQVLAQASAPAAAFETYWFTQRGKNLRAGANGDDDSALRRERPQQAAPPNDRCPNGGGSRNPNDAPRGPRGCP